MVGIDIVGKLGEVLRGCSDETGKRSLPRIPSKVLRMVSR